MKIIKKYIKLSVILRYSIDPLPLGITIFSSLLQDDPWLFEGGMTYMSCLGLSTPRFLFYVCWSVVVFHANCHLLQQEASLMRVDACNNL